MFKSHKTSSLVLALLAATCLTPPESARAEPGDPLGGEFQVNTYTNQSQQWPAIAVDAEGNFVVAWESSLQDDSQNGVFAQRFDATGAPEGPEFPVNIFTTFAQMFPAVAMDADGDFVVAWWGNGPGDTSGIFARRFDSAGVAQDPQDTLVNSHTTNDQRFPAVAMDADGDFVVVWESRNQVGYYTSVFGQRFNAVGEPQGTEFRVNSTTAGDHLAPAVAMDADGDFVVAWYGPGLGDTVGAFARRYNAAGEPQGPEFKTNTFTTGTQAFPSVAMDADGDFVVAWQSYGQDGVGEPYDIGIFAQRFDAAGEAQGDELQVNSFTASVQSFPSVAMDADGDFVVAWQSYGQDYSAYGIFAQRFAAVGTAQGPEFQVNTFTTGGQIRPAVALDADGDFVVSWDSGGSNGQDGSLSGVFAQRYQGDGPVAGDFTVDGRADILWRNTANGNVILWQMDGFTKEDTGPIGGASIDWQVRGLADFNADTNTDILWRNTSTGEAEIWLMDGFTKLATGGIGGGPGWEIVGTGDFDGDDHADILWRNTSSGITVIWRMDGLSRIFGGAGTLGAPPLDWQVAGVGDFDASATSDILWHNTSSGAAVVWLMDGFSKLDSGGIGAPPPVWQVEGLGTFTSDARSDILWRNTTTGNTVIWQMNGLAKEDAASIGTPSLVWRVDGVGDTDGDRQSDIIWRNTGNGSTVVWQMDGFVKDASQPIGTVPDVWEVQ